jgi:hypothetical protein
MASGPSETASVVSLKADTENTVKIRALAGKCVYGNKEALKELVELKLDNPLDRTRRMSILRTSMFAMKETNFETYESFVQELLTDQDVLRTLPAFSDFKTFRNATFFKLAIQDCMVNGAYSRIDNIVKIADTSLEGEVVNKVLFLAIVGDFNVSLLEYFKKRGRFDIAALSRDESVRIPTCKHLRIENDAFEFQDAKKFGFYLHLLSNGWMPCNIFFHHRWVADYAMLHGVKEESLHGLTVMHYDGSTITLKPKEESFKDVVVASATGVAQWSSDQKQRLAQLLSQVLKEFP